jgi:hypothetical protein
MDKTFIVTIRMRSKTGVQNEDTTSSVCGGVSTYSQR